MRSILSLSLWLICVTPLVSSGVAQACPTYPRTINQRQNLQQRRDFRDGGGITSHERYQLNRRLGNLSKSIYQNRRN